jgi:hypothetical protein
MERKADNTQNTEHSIESQSSVKTPPCSTSQILLTKKVDLEPQDYKYFHDKGMKISTVIPSSSRPTYIRTYDDKIRTAWHGRTLCFNETEEEDQN